MHHAWVNYALLFIPAPYDQPILKNDRVTVLRVFKTNNECIKISK